MSIWYKYRKLFLSTFELSACTFGGGFVIIPLMRKKFVEELGWIEEEEMLDLTAIAQASPGAIAVNASIMLGYHIAGIPGAILAVLGTVLPPLIIISIISMFYQAFGNIVFFFMAMRGMIGVFAAVFCDVLINMEKFKLKKKRPLPIIIMLASFIAVRYLSINIIIVIFVCGCIGTLDIWIKNMKRKAGNKQ